MPIFGKSATKRYEEIGPILKHEFCDPTTLVMIEYATEKITQYCGSASHLGSVQAAGWQREISRLVMDGYVLGRVEQKTERERLPFSTTSLAIEDPQGIFRLICAGIVSHATSGGPFTANAPTDTEIRDLLHSFARDACEAVLESIADQDAESVDWRVFGSATITAIHAGREIAVNEGYFLNPKKKNELAMVLEELSAMPRRGDEDSTRGC